MHLYRLEQPAVPATIKRGTEETHKEIVHRKAISVFFLNNLKNSNRMFANSHPSSIAKNVSRASRVEKLPLARENQKWNDISPFNWDRK